MNYLNRPKVRKCSIELQVQRALLTQPPKLRALDLMSDAYAVLSREELTEREPRGSLSGQQQVQTSALPPTCLTCRTGEIGSSACISNG